MSESEIRTSYLNPLFNWKAWLFTTDHKRIGILYAVAITFLFLMGALAALILRLNLTTPHSALVSSDMYNRLFTLHGVIMVWFFLIPSIPNTLGNFLLPLMIGARDVAFPKLNLASFYIYFFAAIFTILVLVLGGLDTGWTFYAPYSTLYSNGYVVAAVCGIFIAGFSSVVTGLNFISTVHNLRAPGMTWMRLPLFVWSLYATSLILVLATPVLGITLVLVAVEKLLHVGIFDPEFGGDPILFQHLFWFYSHPAVYIMILPGMGVASELVTCYARKSIFNYKWVAYSSIAIAVLGFLLWGHHMFVAGQSAYSSIA
ncbi:MAG: cytochrome c oxidase subunit I, partial [Pseudobdellovibrionaceae bacterium]